MEYSSSSPSTIIDLKSLWIFTWDNKNNHNHKDNNNPHLNFFKGTVLGVKEQGLGIRDKR